MSRTQTELPNIDPALSDLNRDVPLSSIINIDAVCDGCGYNLRGLARNSRCPECGEAVAKSFTSHAGIASNRSDRRWATLVLMGVVTLLLIFPSQVWVVLQMSFSEVAFGTAPRLNLPAPKVWAVPLVQRSLGYSVENLGAEGTWLTLAGIIGVFLITTPRRSLVERSKLAIALAFTARWLPPVLVGGFFGFLLNAEGTYQNRVDIAKYANLGVALVELPCTLLLLLMLGMVCRDLRLTAIRTQFLIAAALGLVLQCASVALILIAPTLTSYRQGFVVQLVSSLYEAACVITSMLIIAAMLRLAYELLTLVMPRRAKAWFD